MKQRWIQYIEKKACLKKNILAWISPWSWGRSAWSPALPCPEQPNITNNKNKDMDKDKENNKDKDENKDENEEKKRQRRRRGQERTRQEKELEQEQGED